MEVRMVLRRGVVAAVRAVNGPKLEAMEARRLLTAVPAASADSFVESVGLNGGGGSASLTDAARYADAGFRHVRVAQYDESDPTGYWSRLNQAYDQYGLRWLTTINKEPSPTDLVNRYKQFTRGSVDLVEGNNEVDNTSFYDANYKYVAQNAQGGYWDAMKADPATRDTPLAIFSTVFTDWGGYHTEKADIGNIHYYPGQQHPPLSVDGVNDFFVNRQRMDNALDGPEKGFIVGEDGYSTYRFGNMTDRAKAKGDSMLLAEMFKQGVPRTYLFSFYGSNEGFDLWYGNGYTPAGSAVKHVLTTLSDASWNTSSKSWSYPNFTPGSLDYSISGGDGSVHSQLLQKSNGDYYLLLWQSKQVTDGNGNDINNADVNVTLNFRTALNGTASVDRLDPSSGNYSSNNVGLSGSAGSQSLTVGVPDSLMMIKLSPSSVQYGQTGTLYQEVWTNVGGTATSNIPVQNAPDQVNTINQLEGTYSGDNYGSRIRGYITAPTDGLYTFWVSGDDNCELKLSRLPDQAKDLQSIASVPDWTGYREWNKFASQKSAPIWMLKGRKYYFEVTQKEGGGGDSISVGWAKPGQGKDSPSEVVPGSVLSPVVPSSQALPSGWADADVGTTDLKGIATQSGGVFGLQGNGSDIWNSSDQFHFAYKGLNGDGDLITRVDLQQKTDDWAKAGLMFRDGIGAGDSFAGLFVTSSNGIRFQYRDGAGTNAGEVASTGGAAGVWLKLSRSGNTFTAYWSSNGSSWNTIGSRAISISTNAKAGLAALSHNFLTTGGAQFSNVSIGGVAAGTTLYSDNFESDAIGSPAPGWSVSGGDFAVQQPAGHSRDFRTSGSGLTTYGGGSAWGNYTVQAAVNPGSDTGGASVLFRVQSTNRFYQAELKNDGVTKKLAIWKNDNGSWSQVAAWNYGWGAGGWYNVSVALAGSAITVSIGGTTLGTAYDGTWQTGSIGLRTDGMGAGYDNVQVVQG
jgi:hypothetical protein